MGCLIYLTNTRPDLTFVVSVVRQFMHSSRTSHLDIVYHILRYLKMCPGLGPEPNRASHAIQKLTMRGQRVINALFLASILFMVVISYPKKVRSKLLSLGILPKPSMVPWLRAQVKFFGFDIF